MRRVIAALIACSAVIGLARAQPPAPPDPRVVPAGSGWWCVDMPGATGVCERTRGQCEAAIAMMPWGGLPPPCVARRAATCATYVAGSATSPPSPVYACRRDPDGCTAELAQRRALVRPPDVWIASRCALVR